MCDTYAWGPQQLNNVMCDTYAWGPQQGQDPNLISHGRIRYYDGNEQVISSEGAYSKSTKIEGTMQPFKFQRLKGPAILKYNLPNMTWTLTIQGNDYTTKNVVGKISGEPQKDRIRFNIEDSEFYFNSYITLINPDFT